MMSILTYSTTKPPEEQLIDLQRIYNIILLNIDDIIQDKRNAYVNCMILQHQNQLVHIIKPSLRTRSHLQQLDDLLGVMVTIHMKLTSL
jgi:hypothetical protein